MNRELVLCEKHTSLAIGIQVLYHTVEPFEWESPPSMHGSEELQAFFEVEREVVIGDKVMLESGGEHVEVVVHVSIELRSPFHIHRSSRSQIYSTD